VEVLDGPDAGKRVVADALGKFTVTARASGSVTVRASKAGYQPATSLVVSSSALHHVILRLPGAGSYDAVGAGEYALTLRMDPTTASSRPGRPTCSGFPIELASRTYDARIAEEPVGKRTVTVTGPNISTSWGAGMSFLMFVEGDRAVLNFDENAIGEDLPDFRFLTTYAWTAPGTTAPLNVGTATSIRGVKAEFSYCQFKSARGFTYDCSQAPAGELLAYHHCVSDDATMTFERR
jgi:hypothetical protein